VVRHPASSFGEPPEAVVALFDGAKPLDGLRRAGFSEFKGPATRPFSHRRSTPIYAIEEETVEERKWGER
jgi:hypothetical protein